MFKPELVVKQNEVVHHNQRLAKESWFSSQKTFLQWESAKNIVPVARITNFLEFGYLSGEWETALPEQRLVELIEACVQAFEKSTQISDETQNSQSPLSLLTAGQKMKQTQQAGIQIYVRLKNRSKQLLLPYSRPFTWGFVKKHAKGRVVDFVRFNTPVADFTLTYSGSKKQITVSTHLPQPSLLADFMVITVNQAIPLDLAVAFFEKGTATLISN